MGKWGWLGLGAVVLAIVWFFRSRAKADPAANVASTDRVNPAWSEPTHPERMDGAPPPPPPPAPPGDLQAAAARVASSYNVAASDARNAGAYIDQSLTTITKAAGAADSVVSLVDRFTD